MALSVIADERFENNITLAADAQAGNAESEAKLIEANTALVKKLAVRFRGRGIEYEDLVQIGMIGLVKAARSFDVSRGFAFSTYAVPLIVGEIKRTLRDDGLIKVGRRQKKLAMDLMGAKTRIMNEEGRDPTISELAQICGVCAEEAAMALDAISPVSSLSDASDEEGRITLESRIADPDDEIERVRDRIALGQAIEKLSPLHKKIVLLRFFRNLTQQSTAAELGLSQVKVSREEKKIMEHLRKELA